MRADSNIGKGIAAGIAGGLVASAVMNQFQALWGKLLAGEEHPHGTRSLRQGLPQHGVSRELQKRGSDDENDNAAVRAGNAVAELVFNQKLTRDEKETAGAVAHYATGMASGAVYGAVAEVFPEATIGEGLPFGAAVWLIVDEGAVPALGLSKGPAEYPFSTHVYALASHFVFGLTVELVRRTVRRAM